MSTSMSTGVGSDAGTESELAIAWARGAAANPTAPLDVLLRLLDPVARPAWKVLCGGRALPDEVVDAIVSGAEVTQKKLLARNPHATPEQRGRLASDPDAMVRYHVARGPERGTWLVRPLPDDVIEVFYTAESRGFPPGLVTANEIAQELAFSGQIRARYDLDQAAHRDPTMRLHAAWSWEWLAPEEQAAMLADPDPRVRAAAEHQASWQDPVANESRLVEHWTHGRTNMMMMLPFTQAVAERELADERGRDTMTYNRFTPPDIVERLARDPDPGIRAAIATRFGLPAQIRAELEQDPDEDVRTRARAFGAATAAGQHAALLRNVSNGSFSPIAPLDGPVDLGDPDWYVRAAESDNVLLRRAAAWDPRLPPPQVRRLASDPDQEVRSLLAHHHPDAPPELMIEVFIAEPESRALMLRRPQMPRTGLAYLLDHPEPQLRALAAADSTLPSPPVAQLDDEDERVRRAAASNALLPADVVERLLQDPRHAEGAAANPRLDAETLRRLVDDAGIRARTT
jgi:hypothetical protein